MSLILLRFAHIMNMIIKAIKNMSNVLNCLDKVKPIYKEFSGWKESVAKSKSFEDLPSEAKIYIDFLSTQLGVPIKIISVGPKRKQIILK